MILVCSEINFLEKLKTFFYIYIKIVDEPNNIPDPLSSRRGTISGDISHQTSIQSDDIHLSKIDLFPTRGT